MTAHWRLCTHIIDQLLELAVGDESEKRFAVLEMVIDGHGRDAHGIGHAPEAHRIRAFLFQNGERGGGYLFARVRSEHLYSV